MKKIKNSIANLYLTLVFTLLPSLSHAKDVTSIVNRTVVYLQGGVARSIGILAIVIGGYLCIVKQTFPKAYFISLLIGLGIIFGASSIYSVTAG